MIFSTYWFLAAVAAFLPVYFLVRSAKIRVALLIVFSLLFHGHFAGPAGVVPIIVLATITYAIGRSRNKAACLLGICIAVTALCFYKYTHFVCDTIIAPANPSLAKVLDQASAVILPASPPLAISFFSFEFIHYLFEVRRGRRPIYRLTDFIQFTFFFPSLVAGPIKRYGQFIPALKQGLRYVTTRDVSEGMLRVAAGFFKKLCLADNLTLYINYNAPRFPELTIQERWLVLAAIALRIYFDFSGYSDIAIGFARTLGITIPKNFNWPYLATNIQEFWQRWHISLSTWIRDYVYIPLGGNRVGTARRVFNALLAFSLCGLWHGPALNFLLWGLYHGIGLAICSTYRTSLGAAGRLLGGAFDRIPVLSWACTIMFVAFGWLLFFYPIPEALKMTVLLFRVA